jgi:hypothetical protein
MSAVSLDADWQPTQRRCDQLGGSVLRPLPRPIEIEYGESPDLLLPLGDRLSTKVEHVGWCDLAALDPAREFERAQHLFSKSRQARVICAGTASHALPGPKLQATFRARTPRPAPALSLLVNHAQ